jgi:hypothetical protein
MTHIFDGLLRIQHVIGYLKGKFHHRAGFVGPEEEQRYIAILLT